MLVTLWEEGLTAGWLVLEVEKYELNSKCRFGKLLCIIHLPVYSSIWERKSPVAVQRKCMHVQICHFWILWVESVFILTTLICPYVQQRSYWLLGLQLTNYFYYSWICQLFSWLIFCQKIVQGDIFKWYVLSDTQSKNPKLLVLLSCMKMKNINLTFKRHKRLKQLFDDQNSFLLSVNWLIVAVLLVNVYFPPLHCSTEEILL